LAAKLGQASRVAPFFGTRCIYSLFVEFFVVLLWHMLKMISHLF